MSKPPPPRRLILASSSPYRRALLERLHIPFTVMIPGIDETPFTGETPAKPRRKPHCGWQKPKHAKSRAANPRH